MSVYQLWFCTWKGWRANECSCAVGGYSHSMTGCGWVAMSGKVSVERPDEDGTPLKNPVRPMFA